jgi:aspartyl-tRNA(Asn)/glutamyl-tRNA(Gln) amidotransferase subunit A
MTRDTISSLRDAVRHKQRSAVDVCEEALARLDRLEPSLHALVTVARDRALTRAAQIDRDARHDLPLMGVPVCIKDTLCTAGLTTTASSRMLESFVPPFDATPVARLERAGAVVIAKANCDEFAMGSSTENSAFGPTRNPWDLDRIPGGSSGGSAVAVAAGYVPLALGSDTGGSIRQPAAHCGIVGLKPTYGRVSRYGLLAYASSLDCVGPMTTCVADAALALSIIAGSDECDATSARQDVSDYSASLTGDLRDLRIGIPAALLDKGVDGAVSRAFESARAVLAERGAMFVDLELPHAAVGIPVYYLIATAEASSNLARYDGVRYGFRADLSDSRAATLSEMYAQTRARGFGTEVKRRIMLGTYVLSAGYYDAYYRKAQQVRTLIRQDFDRAFQRVDVILTPTSPSAAFRIGEKTADPLQMYLSDVFTVSANLAGLPAISVPCGFTPEGLPIGLQMTGRAFDEATVLRAAEAYERDTTWASAVPPAVSGAWA